MFVGRQSNSQSSRSYVEKPFVILFCQLVIFNRGDLNLRMMFHACISNLQNKDI